MSWTDTNGLWDLVYDALGDDVAPGTAPFLQWGYAYTPKDPGGHPDYGADHVHLLAGLTAAQRSQALRAILKNEVSRHYAFYQAPLRGPYGPTVMLPWKIGEDDKPVLDWAPTAANEAVVTDSVGPVIRNGISLKNPDEQHAWSLLDVAAQFNDPVPFLPTLGFPTAPCSFVAKARLQVLAHGMAGILRQPGYQTVQQGGAVGWGLDRVYGVALRLLLKAHKHGLLSEEDKATVYKTLEIACAFYAQAPGMSIHYSGKGGQWKPAMPENSYFFLVPQTAWAAEVLYDWAAAIGLSNFGLAINLAFTAKRLGRYVADCAYPDGSLPWAVRIPATQVSLPKAPDSLQVLDSEKHSNDADWLGAAWAWRGATSSALLGDPVAKAWSDKLYLLQGEDPALYSWFVAPGPQLGYVNAKAKALAASALGPQPH